MERSSNNEISAGLFNFGFGQILRFQEQLLMTLVSAGGVVKSDVGGTRAGSVLPLQDMLVSDQSFSSL